MLIQPSDIDQIVQWGIAAGGVEICGILLTRFDGGPRLKNIPNGSDEPSDMTFMTIDDIMEALLELVGDPDSYPGDLTRELVVWHTHPGGMVGPSRLDMEYRRKLGSTRCLVVTIPSGKAVQF